MSVDPARDPQGSWSSSASVLTADEEVVFCAICLLNGASRRYPVINALIRFLTEHPDSYIESKEIASQLELGNGKIVVDMVAWVNKHAHALGYVPLIRYSENGYMLDSAASRILHEALEWAG